MRFSPGIAVATSLLCALSGVVLGVQAPAGYNSPAPLHQELLRRLSAAEPLASLFVPDARLPDTTGWRWMVVRGDSLPVEPGNSNAGEASSRFSVTLEREAPIDADCPVVEEVIQRSNGVQVWQEHGHVEVTYQRAVHGWRVARFVYTPD